MPRIARKKKVSKPRRRPVVRRPRRVRRAIRNTPEYASLSVRRTFTAPGGGNFNVNQMYTLMNTTLDQFDRAATVAQAYQHYRIKYINITVKSPYDTYASQAAGWSKPKLFYMLDKAGALPTNINLEGLKQMGAKPRDLDEKPLNIGWRPSVLQVDMIAPGGPGVVNGQATQYKISPWLSTSNVSVGQPWNPSTVDHLGVYWYVEAAATGVPPAPLIYFVEVEVQFEFKKPLISNSVGLSDALPAITAKLDLSPDGVEGGTDGITIPKL